MANDEFDNARTDKAMLKQLHAQGGVAFFSSMARGPMSSAEREGRYRDYQRGWTDGAKGTTLPLETPEPEFRDEYDQGATEARRARSKALKARFDALFR